MNTGTTLTLTMAAGGTRDLTGSKANTVQQHLENMERIMPLFDEDTNKTEYLFLADGACGFCVVAESKPTSEAGEPVPCEEGIPACPGNELNPTTPYIRIVNAVNFVPVNGEVTLAVDTNSDSAITWTSDETQTATVTEGKVTGVKVGTTKVTAKLATGQEATATINVIAA